MTYKNGRYYMAKCQWKGQPMRKSAWASDAKNGTLDRREDTGGVSARELGHSRKEARPYTSRILEEAIPTLRGNSLRPQPKTLDYYLFGANMLTKSDLATVRLDEITDQRGGRFAVRHSNRSPSTANCGLRTLRRALSPAVPWGEIERMPKISLAKGERQRERVLTDDEVTRYLRACCQPWKDAATLILGTGLCPDRRA